jgi:hypothetical protein
MSTIITGIFRYFCGRTEKIQENPSIIQYFGQFSPKNREIQMFSTRMQITHGELPAVALRGDEIPNKTLPLQKIFIKYRLAFLILAILYPGGATNEQ